MAIFKQPEIWDPSTPPLPPPTFLVHKKFYEGNAYLPNLLDLSRVSLFKQQSPDLTILVYFLPASTKPPFFFCLRLFQYRNHTQLM